MRYLAAATAAATMATVALAPSARAQAAPEPSPLGPPPTSTGTTLQEPAVSLTPSPPPSGDTIAIYRSSRPNRPLLLTGALVLAASYAPTAVVAATSNRDGDSNLYAPVVGPWLNLADRQCEGCSTDAGTTALLIGSGALQGVGVLMGIASFILPQRVEVARLQAGPVTLQFAPTSVGRSAYGLGAVGEF